MADITPAVLTPILTSHFDDSYSCLEVTRGPVGNGQETWFAEVQSAAGRRSLVLRRSAADGPMSYTDRAREFEALRRLSSLGLPVPVAHWFEAEGSQLERPYFVMERMPGGPVRAGEPAALAQVARELGGHLARLHRLAPAAAGAADATRSELGTWKRRYLATRPAPVPLIGALLAWMEANLPPLEGSAVLTWGDPGPHNLLVEGGHVSALLDWEMSHPGHPLEDLGAAVWACLGLLDPEPLIAGYEEAGQAVVDRDLLAYFEVMAGVTRTIALGMGVAAFVDGTINTPVTAGLGLELLGANLGRAALAAGWEPAPAPEPPSPPSAYPGLLPSPAQSARGVARLLESEVLAAVADRRLRRLVKNAGALLETSAARLDAEAGLAGWRRLTIDPLLQRLRDADVPARDLEEAGVTVETEPAHAAWRPEVRRVMLQELAAERAAFGALRDLYGAGAAAAPLTRPATSC